MKREEERKRIHEMDYFKVNSDLDIEKWCDRWREGLRGEGGVIWGLVTGLDIAERFWPRLR